MPYKGGKGGGASFSKHAINGRKKWGSLENLAEKGRRECFRNDLSCGRGRVKFQQPRLMWLGKRGQVQQVRPARTEKRRDTFSIHPSKGGERREFQLARNIRARKEASFNNRALYERGGKRVLEIWHHVGGKKWRVSANARYTVEKTESVSNHGLCVW